MPLHLWGDRGDSGCDVVEFQVAHHEEKIGRSLSHSHMM